MAGGEDDDLGDEGGARHRGPARALVGEEGGFEERESEIWGAPPIGYSVNSRLKPSFLLFFEIRAPSFPYIGGIGVFWSFYIIEAQMTPLKERLGQP